jgi:hypothetical protein
MLYLKFYKKKPLVNLQMSQCADVLVGLLPNFKPLFSH